MLRVLSLQEMLIIRNMRTVDIMQQSMRHANKLIRTLYWKFYEFRGSYREQMLLLQYGMVLTTLKKNKQTGLPSFASKTASRSQILNHEKPKLWSQWFAPLPSHLGTQWRSDLWKIRAWETNGKSGAWNHKTAQSESIVSQVKVRGYGSNRNPWIQITANNKITGTGPTWARNRGKKIADETR